MHSVTMVGPVVYRHIDRPLRLGRLACPLCQTEQVAFHSFRHRIVEHLDVEQPTALVLKVAKYACCNAACERKYFTPAVAEAAPCAHTSRRLQQTSSQLYRGGKLALRDVEGLSTEETAETLGLSIPAVKSRLLRARLQLRERLSRYFKRKTGSATVGVEK